MTAEKVGYSLVKDPSHYFLHTQRRVEDSNLCPSFWPGSALAPRRDQPLCQPSDSDQHGHRITAAHATPITQDGWHGQAYSHARVLAEGEGLEPPRHSSHACFRDRCLAN